jgi:hypothetical protein
MHSFRVSSVLSVCTFTFRFCLVRFPAARRGVHLGCYRITPPLYTQGDTRHSRGQNERWSGGQIEVFVVRGLVLRPANAPDFTWAEKALRR